jgi:lon-related putative ATP-dependent protease
MKNSKQRQTLNAAELACQPGAGQFQFKESTELEAFIGPSLGHRRAMKALEFGLDIERTGYNMFVSGSPGTGRMSLTRSCIDSKAASAGPVRDSVYLPNFSEPKNPKSTRLPAGLGSVLLSRIDNFLCQLIASIAASVESPAFQREKSRVESEFTQRYEELLSGLAGEAQALGVYLNRDGESISFSPLLGDSPANEEEFEAFSEQDKEAFHAAVKSLESTVVERLLVVPLWRRETRQRLDQLHENAISAALDPPLESLTREFSCCDDLCAYFGELRTYLKTWLLEDLAADRSTEAGDDRVRKGKLNKDCVPRVLVSHDPAGGRPVVVENNPTLRNLFGYVESVTEQGSVVTRHSLIYPGSVHLANDGYLIIEAEKLVAEPQVWPALKRTLKSGAVRIESTSQDLSLASPVSLNPQNFPLQLKVVLIGSPDLFYLLQELDSEFIELFRVLCEFDDDMERTAETETELIGLLESLRSQAGIRPFSGRAARLLIRESCRLAEDQQRLSLRVADLLELLVEADQCRKANDAAVIDREHIEKALADRTYRASRLSEQVLREIVDGSILIETEGSAIGRVNGLTVIDIGSNQFGNPARISATIFPGSRGVVDIEREVELGEAIHSKGVMILTGYLGQRYARDLKMAFSANLALEQSYGHVDGDSASLAELCALVSALAELPIKQELAVTGSINQYGEVQPVGGVNEKIEGFFGLCRARGLNGNQGVVIPHTNKRHLVLNDDVVEAVAAGQFHVWTVATVDMALSILTGKSTSSIDKRVLNRLKALSELSEHSDM